MTACSNASHTHLLLCRCASLGVLYIMHALPPRPNYQVSHTPPKLPVCRPTCRLFVENQLCCQSEGLLTSATYANVRVLCNQPVTLTADCISVDGPSNVTIVDVLNGNPSYSHQYLVNFQGADYYGHVNINLERQR